jgi:low affinity Fe/Cu permease
VNAAFAHLAERVAHYAGHPVTVLVAFALILAWALTGPAYGFSERWQMIVNTGTTIVTFLLVFVIQASQNRDGLAIQAKLDELIRASKDARNLYIGLDRLTEQEIEHLRGQSTS